MDFPPGATIFTVSDVEVTFHRDGDELTVSMDRPVLTKVLPLIGSEWTRTATEYSNGRRIARFSRRSTAPSSVLARAVKRREASDKPPAILVDCGFAVLAVTPEIRALLGTASDREVAARVGKDRSWIARVRKALDIPAEYGRTARRELERELRLEARKRFQQGQRSTQIAAEMGAPLQSVQRWTHGMSVATTWDQLREILTFLGPLSSRELRGLWVPEPHRYLGLYVGDGWVVRQPDGRYALTGRGPAPGPTPEE